jgi:hypothetical protein
LARFGVTLAERDSAAILFSRSKRLRDVEQ